MLFEQFDGLTHHIATAACAGRRSAGFNAHHTVIAFEYKIFHPQFFGMKVHGFKHINDRRKHFFSQREGAVMLGVTADLQHTFSHFGKCSRQIRGGGAFADTAFAIDRKDFGVADFHIRIELALHTAFAVLS